jgi:hypothetical protein
MVSAIGPVSGAIGIRSDRNNEQNAARDHLSAALNLGDNLFRLMGSMSILD